MKAVKIILIVLLEVLFLLAFIFFLPELIQFFGNQLAAILVVGIMVIGSGIFVGIAFHKSRRGIKRNGVD